MEYVVETEKEIVQNYIIKSKQERIEWELNHPQKRKDIIWHFHKPDIFKEACLHPVDYMDQEAMKNYLHKLSSAENVYFIGEDYIGEMSLEQAVERANEGEICIIYCGNGIGYYQGEQEKGAPPRFMLLAEKCYNTCIRGDLMLKREISECLYSWKNENKKSVMCDWCETDWQKDDYPRICPERIRVFC